jgi:hypothetical protein
MKYLTTYRPAAPHEVYVGSSVYIRLQHANMRAARVTALVPEVGILLKVSGSTVPPWGIPYTLPELYVKVD